MYTISSFYSGLDKICRQCFEYFVSWGIFKERLPLPKKKINPNCKSVQPPFSFPNGTNNSAMQGSNKKRGKGLKLWWNTQCSSQNYTDKPHSSPRQKKLWLQQENTIKQKAMSHRAAQDSWSWSFLQAAHIVSIKNNTGNLHKRSAYVCVSRCFV